MVDRVVITKHPQDPADMSVYQELSELRPHIFANGGDRKEDNIPEVALCNEIGCKMVFNVGRGGKVQSSSWLSENFIGGVPCHCGSGKKYRDCHGAAQVR